MIETERLLLRRYVVGDAEELVALYNNAEFRRFIPISGLYDRARALARIEDDEREWEELGHRMLAVVEQAHGRFLGRVAIYDWPELGETEIGWALRADARGCGFATEAANACVEWAFTRLPVRYVTAMIQPGNLPSIGVAARLGMTMLRHDRLFDRPVAVYAMTRDDWSGGRRAGT